MRWNYKEPLRKDYDCDEDYEDALQAYESALDDYCDRYQERKRY